MKILFVILTIALVMPFTGCQTADVAKTQVVTVQTLKAVGQSADAVVAQSAHLYAQGVITAAQANAIREFYDSRFQPPFRIAVAAAKTNLDPASPELVGLAAQLAAILVQAQNK